MKCQSNEINKQQKKKKFLKIDCLTKIIKASKKKEEKN